MKALLLGRALMVGVLVSFILAAPASAGTTPNPPVSLSTGFVDYPSFQAASAPARHIWLGRARALGAQSVRLTLYWSSIAPFTFVKGFQPRDPAAPAYRWSSLDAAIRDATAAGLTPVLMVTAAPKWAEGPNRPAAAMPGAWEPKLSALAAFAHALALRYSGHFRDPLHPALDLPRVSYFQAWDEPNLPTYLEPQWSETPDGTFIPASPAIYRGLLNAFYNAVKAVQPNSFVLSAGTAPYGDPPGQGEQRMSPVLFLQQLFCLTATLSPLPCPAPPRFDALDHHPYALAPNLHARQPGDIAVPDLDKIWSILDAAEKVGHAQPAGPKSLWITEISWDSGPSPGPKSTLQARKAAWALYVLWQQGVSHVFWFQLSDPEASKKSFTNGGLYFSDGEAKPAASAFYFPFVALPAKHQKVTLWGRAPSAGTVLIQKLVNNHWRTLFRMRTNAGGIFTTQRRLGTRLQLRARIGNTNSLGWSTIYP